MDYFSRVKKIKFKNDDRQTNRQHQQANNMTQSESKKHKNWILFHHGWVLKYRIAFVMYITSTIAQSELESMP
jgi:hypothetical protein